MLSTFSSFHNGAVTEAQQEQTDDLSRETLLRTTQVKATKTQSELEYDAWAAWVYPPEFWDGLSEVLLTRKALRELDRRNHVSSPAASNEVFQQPLCELVRFARHGGPDLRDLRGYPEPELKSLHPAAMSFRASSQKWKTNPYDPNFELHLIDHGVHPEEFSDEPELTEIVSKLTERRLSLSPSRFSDGDFKAFRQSNRRAKSEAEVLANVVPTILGSNQTMYPSARDTTFGNLERITDGSIVPAKPDIYDGAYPAALLPSVRKELFHRIVPSSTQDKPMAPNLFMEVKGPAGDLAVAMRQAQYDGAVGSRAVHTLQNYGNDKPQYDGQAYTFSSTYHGATLTIYAHHTTAPTTDGGRPEYHMTQVKAYALTSDCDTFVQGATALRNVRDLAKCHRDRFIQAANAKAIQRAPTAPRDEATALGALDGEGISGESVDCTGSPFPDTSDGAVHTGNCSQAPGLSASADTATSHISSVTSGFAAGSGKRLRQPLSPNSECNTKALHTRVNI